MIMMLEFVSLQLVEVIGQIGQGILETLALPGVHDDLVGLAGRFLGISWHDLPVVEHALREGLAASVGAKVSSES